MIKRTVEISKQPAYLSVRNGQLLIHAQDGAKQGDGSQRAESTHRGVRARLTDDEHATTSIPCEDIGVLIVDHPGVTYSHGALSALLDADAAVILCGNNHLPAGLLLPLGEHSQVVWRLRDQINAPKPLCKQLWRQIIQAKIRASAENLSRGSETRSKLLALARNVRSGDPTNIEAQAARAYWAAYRDSLRAPEGRSAFDSFRRDPDGPPPNDMLNYGYAVMRAAVARAIVAAGLLPAVGLHHANRSNAFCLADDMVEPLRPMVDARVRELLHTRVTEVNPEAKRGLLELLAINVQTGAQTGPLMVALHRYAASLVKCFRRESSALEIPVACI